MVWEVYFKPRGKFTIQMDSDGNVAIVNADKFGITEDILSAKALLASGGLYKLRMRSTELKNAPYVQTSIPACSLQRSGFKEDLALFISADQSHSIRGTSYNSPVIGMARTCDPNALKAPSMFLSRIKVERTKSTGHSSPSDFKEVTTCLVNVATETYTDKDGNTRVRQASMQQNLPWYRKYWYLLLAGAIYLMLSPSDAPAAKPKND